MAKKKTATRAKRARRKVVRVRFSDKQGRSIHARYDAAQTTSDNQKHWAAADSLSAASALTAAVRLKLRTRARYEVANNSYATGIGLTLANYVIGRNPRLNVRTGDDALDLMVEQEFGRWARAVKLGQKLRTGRFARYQDGEVFIQKTTDKAVRHEVKLNPVLIETDRIASPPIGREKDGEIEGITYDENGNPITYRVLSEHPGDSYTAGGFTLVKSAQMIHWFRADRPGQLRGAPDITSALGLFAELRRYRQAVIAAAETAADHAMVLQSDAPGDEEDMAEAMDTIELERRMATFLPAGYKLSQTQAEQPTTTYNLFESRILNEIARCLNMPYNIAACNSAGYNYASGNLDHQTFWKSVGVEQQEISDHILDDLFESWLEEARRIEGYLPALPKGTPEHQWFYDKREHADPVKESTAQQMRLMNGTSTYEEEAARDGVDPETRWNQRVKEWKRAKDAGVPYPIPQGTAAENTGDDEDATTEEK
ncbi:MAG TPA: phage portal protein [Terracidiphilus sp.]|nr:phage portal protein [Terracidiphilus sp.]